MPGPPMQGDAKLPTTQTGHGFGTLPVFLAGISTILGAIMFLRFGYAVGHVGLLGVFGIIVLGHLVTLPTALALAEIATNRKVEGGGEYFIISRSFGTTIGGVIGISLYLSQAVSVAFYMIAFAEAFTPLAPWFEAQVGIPLDVRFISVPGLIVLLLIVLTRGADVGVKLLYGVVAVLMVSLALFFLGRPLDGVEAEAVTLGSRITDSDGFFIVFAIVFPAFTGMTAGVGLSGDLRNPRASIPKGTLLATIVGMIAYVCIVLKLHYSAPPQALADNQLIMADIALWGPAILIGLGCATLSSAIGSVLVAPRTLQALGGDDNIPLPGAGSWLARGTGQRNEPRNATIMTGILALVIVLLGNVNIVARLISMFFMVTYGSLCAISFLEHFAARPSYRPAFRSRWYLSLLGALMCLFLMFQMDPVFAFLALLWMVGLYQITRRTKGGEADLAAMFRGAMTQAMRYMHIKLQRGRREDGIDEWRPSIIMVNERTFDRRSPLMMVRWLSHRYGFGTYLHYIRGLLNAESVAESGRTKQRLLELARMQRSTVYMDTIVSPSMTSALAQSLQIPGVTGTPNNMVMFEFSKQDASSIVEDLVEECLFAARTRKTLLVLRHSDYHFGERDSIHIWLTWNDEENANMVILLSYILLGHPDWHKAAITVYVALPSAQVDDAQKRFQQQQALGRLPISDKSIEYIAIESTAEFREQVVDRSQFAALVVLGFSVAGLEERGTEVFTNLPSLRDVLFVSAPEDVSFD